MTNIFLLVPWNQWGFRSRTAPVMVYYLHLNSFKTLEVAVLDHTIWWIASPMPASRSTDWYEYCPQVVLVFMLSIASLVIYFIDASRWDMLFFIIIRMILSDVFEAYTFWNLITRNFCLLSNEIRSETLIMVIRLIIINKLVPN